VNAVSVPPKIAPPAPVTATKISTIETTVTWCHGSGCHYPNTRLHFRLSRATTVRLVLSAEVHGRWRQVAAMSIRAHRGVNGYRLAGRWHGELVPVRQMRLRILVRRDGRWRTQNVVVLSVRHESV
jgi:hypothetical protein